MPAEHGAALRRFEERLTELEQADYTLTLFVAGASDLSAAAISSIRSLCEVHLSGRYLLHVIDIHRDAALVSSHNVLAVPTLIRHAPLPERRLVGDLSNTARVLGVLGVASSSAPQTAGQS